MRPVRAIPAEIALLACLLATAPPASAQAPPPCFGAASRAPEAPCVNPDLAWTAVPRPSEAVAQPNGACRFTADPDFGLDLCVFGASGDPERATVALVGDSHASGMRPAVQAPAARRGWTVASITHTSCPLSTAVRRLSDPLRFASCAAWKERVVRWFAVHPEIHTVFVSGLSGGAGVVRDPGLTGYETAVHGYLDAWDLLPPTVRGGCAARACGSSTSPPPTATGRGATRSSAVRSCTATARTSPRRSRRRSARCSTAG